MSDETIEGEGRNGEATQEKRTPAEEVAQSLLQPEQVRIWEDPFQNLCISVDGNEHMQVRPRHVFPLTSRADYISFLDEKDHEVALLAHPHKLDKASRQALKNALGRMYYVAKITRVDAITEKMGVSQWEVETDRGYASFEVVDRNTIRKLPGGRLMIQDVDGSRFEVEDSTKLDERSQALLFSET